MDSFFDENPEFDNSGTNDDPLFLGWIRGKNNAKGKKLVHKIYGVSTPTYGVSTPSFHSTTPPRTEI